VSNVAVGCEDEYNVLKFAPGVEELGDDWIVYMKHTCALDLADEGPLNLHTVGEILGVSRERARQVFESAYEKVKEKNEDLADYMRRAYEISKHQPFDRMSSRRHEFSILENCRYGKRHLGGENE
jgi:hypothetical protein